MSGRPTITALVPTYNEEHNIRDCLSCLTWVDQIIVVDSFSTDRTVEIARQFTPHVYQHEYVNSATQKNWAMENLPIEGEWTLIVDADERIVPELAEEIQSTLATDGGRYVGYFINRRQFCFGRWIRHMGFYPNWNLRLFRTGMARYENKEVDADVALDGGEVGFLSCPMDHLMFPTVSSFMKMLDRYSTWDALEYIKPWHDDSAVTPGPRWRHALNRVLKACFDRLPARWLWRFLYLYVLRLGFLHGRAGFTLAALFAVRQLLADAKVWELRSEPRAREQQMRAEATRRGPG